MAAVGSLSKIVITGKVYIAAFTYEAANILIQRAMVDKLLKKSTVTIAAKIPNVIKYATMYWVFNKADKSFLYAAENK